MQGNQFLFDLPGQPEGLKAEWGSSFVRENSGHPSFKDMKTYVVSCASQLTNTYCIPILPIVYRRHRPCQSPSGISCAFISHTCTSDVGLIRWMREQIYFFDGCFFQGTPKLIQGNGKCPEHTLETIDLFQQCPAGWPLILGNRDLIETIGFITT